MAASQLAAGGATLVCASAAGQLPRGSICHVATFLRGPSKLPAQNPGIAVEGGASIRVQRRRRSGLAFAAADGAAQRNMEDISHTYLPAAPFYKVEAMIRPWRLSFVAQALLKMGIRGVTVCDVKGFGSQGGSRERQAGSEFTDDKFVSKVKLEVVVVHEQVDEVVDCIINEARTGEIGDGKIFISPVSDVIRVRTGERGIEAERMVGGRMEILAGGSKATTENGTA